MLPPCEHPWVPPPRRLFISELLRFEIVFLLIVSFLICFFILFFLKNNLLPSFFCHNAFSMETNAHHKRPNNSCCRCCLAYYTCRYRSYGRCSNMFVCMNMRTRCLSNHKLASRRLPLIASLAKRGLKLSFC